MAKIAYSGLCAAAITMLTATYTFAQELRESYVARLSVSDHYNSSGLRLRSVAAIIRQDRANFHELGRGDQEDQVDQFFSIKTNRNIMERLLERGSIEQGAGSAILNGTPLVIVKIYRYQGRDYIQVGVQ